MRISDWSSDVCSSDLHASAGATAAFVDWLTVEHPEYMDAMTSQPPEYLQAPAEAMHGFLTEVDSRHGSLEGLAATRGISPVTIDQLPHTLPGALGPYTPTRYWGWQMTKSGKHTPTVRGSGRTRDDSRGLP